MELQTHIIRMQCRFARILDCRACPSICLAGREGWCIDVPGQLTHAYKSTNKGASYIANGAVDFISGGLLTAGASVQLGHHRLLVCALDQRCHYRRCLPNLHGRQACHVLSDLTSMQALNVACDSACVTYQGSSGTMAQLLTLMPTSRMRLAMPGSNRRASKRSLLSWGVAARSCSARRLLSAE